MPYVDVQHPETGEFVRFFKTYREAEQYVKHMREDRHYLAEIRRECPMPQEEAEEPKWKRYQERVRNGKV